MSKVIKRLLTFFIGIPLILAIVFLDFQNHLAMNIVIVTFGTLGCNELYNMLSTQSKMFPRWLLLTFSFLILASAYLFNLIGIDMILNIWVMIFEIIILMAIECLSAKTFEDSVKKIAFGGLALFYTGFMPTLISYITFIPVNATYYLVLFFLISFLTDSFAWFFGVLFGKNNRGFIAASPNKSIVGFAGGILATLIVSILVKIIFPEVFVGGYWKIVVVSIATSLAAIIGDLAESVIKRSTGIKDSGNLIPGRGGVLDSIDSLLIAGPVYYLCIYFLYLV